MIFGPLIILTLSVSLKGGTIISSFTIYFSGSVISGYSPSILGSVISPIIAAAIATSGLQRYTLSSFVPLLPGKFLGNVLNEAVPVAGDCPIPIHPRHPD